MPPAGCGAAPHMAACFSTGHALPAGGRVAALFDDQALFLFLVRHRVRRGIRLRRRLCPASRTGNSAQSSAARHNGEADFPGQIERQKSACHGKDHKRDFKHNRLLNIMRFESVCPLKDAPGSARFARRPRKVALCGRRFHEDDPNGSAWRRRRKKSGSRVPRLQHTG